ncbi:Hint domain-containing protein [Roseovarius arcticus]|uniref:Hint domain-containing protein n=1 Tax=Roseovarius arcticus TaxID=2547404 RepID=UPI0011108D32|nr:Hint domain-containing protein [Roseovarius arcticus]
MPTHNFAGFSPSDISFLQGSRLRIDSLYDAGAALSFEIFDEDPHWSGAAHSNQETDDPTQQVTTVRDGDGNVVASGQSYLEEGYTLTDEYGSTVTIYQVMIGGTVVGYVADGPLQPGNTYTYSTSDVTPSSQPEYANLESQSYDPDPDNDILGTDDDDSLRGWSGNDYIDGGAGNDTIEGDQGNDTILGGDGDDYISLWGGADSVDGGAGSDTIQLHDNFGNDTISGGEDDDSLDLSLLSDPVTVTFSGDEAGTVTDGTDTIGFSEIETIITTDGADYVDGRESSADATILLGDGNDTAYGTFGDDSISGGDGDDFIDSWGGYDTIDGGAGNDTVLGGSEDDLVMGGDGDDSLQGWTGRDTLLGGAGNDTLESWEGDELLDGGDDADTFLITEGSGNDTIIGGEGGTDNDTIDLSGLSGPVTVTYHSSESDSGTITDGANTITFSEIEHLILTDQNDSVDGSDTYSGLHGDAPGIKVDAGGGNDTVIGGRGGDTIDGGAGQDKIDGEYGDDYLRGRAGDDTLRGGEGNDTILGDDGADSIEGGLEADALYGGEGDDTIHGGEGDDALIGDRGADLIFGGQGEDDIDGGLGNDTLEGGEGDDTLDGGSGNDSLTGGDGNDVFEMSDGNDTITDFNVGNSGTLNDGDSTNNDFIDLSGYYDHISELHADQADDQILNQSNTTDTRGRSTDYSDNDQFGSRSMRMQGASADNSSFTQENTGVVCFTSGTAIRTPTGDTLIDELAVGDLVCTMDNGPQPIRWIGKRSLNSAELAKHPRLRPILIQRGVLGVERDLLVSPQHGMLIGRETQLARAKHLAETTKGIRIANGKKRVTYIHVMFDVHQIIFAENAPSESFYPGPMGLKMMDLDVRDEIFALFPELSTDLTRDAISSIYGQTARCFVPKRDIKDCLNFAASQLAHVAPTPASATI